MPRRSQEPQVRTMAPGATVTVMDGSMGRQLVVEGLPRGDLFHKIWAASALADPAYHELIVSGYKIMICILVDLPHAQALCVAHMKKFRRQILFY